VSADELTAARAGVARLRAAQATGVSVELLDGADEADARSRADAIVAWAADQRPRHTLR